jgi:hypothetical protein
MFPAISATLIFMRRIISALFLAALGSILLMFNSKVVSYSTGAPMASTSAPGETGCGTNMLCHNGVPNSGSGGTMLTTMENISNGYVPGATYTIMPYVSQAGSSKIGFQTVALLASGQGAGSVTITNLKTQVNAEAGKEYVTHTASGNLNVGLHDWMYEWTAPPAGSGTVTIYGAFLATNNDMTASGDSIYTDSLVITENTTGIEDRGNNYFRINSVSQVGQSDEFYISYFSNRAFPGKITVYDVHGKLVKTAGEFFREGSNKAGIMLEHSSGIHFISINFAGGNKVIKTVKI